MKLWALVPDPLDVMPPPAKIGVVPTEVSRSAHLDRHVREDATGDGDGDDASTPCRMVHFDVIGTVRCGIPVASGEGRQVKEGFVIRREIDELEDGKGRRAFLSNIRDDIDLIEEDDVSREEDTEEGDAHDEGHDSDLSTPWITPPSDPASTSDRRGPSSRAPVRLVAQVRHRSAERAWSTDARR